MQTLYPWQQEGSAFLSEPNPLFKKPHRYLAWATGTGKTPIVCDALTKIGAKSAIIICTKATKASWRRHLIEWGVFKPDDIHVYEGSYDFARIQKKCLIINYELFDYDIIHKQFCDNRRGLFDVIVIDEAHKLASWKSERCKKIIGSNNPVAGRCYHKWLISATPMNNRSMELYTPLRVMAPELIKPYDTYEKFGKYFCNGYQDAGGMWQFKGNSNTQELKLRISPLFNVKTYEDLKDDADIPGVIEDDVFLDIGDVVDENGGIVDDTNTLDVKLRQYTGICKVPYAVEFIKDKLEDSDDKYLIYFFHRAVGEALRRELPNSVLVYGGINEATRQEAINGFMKLKHIRILLAQEDTIGTGYDGLQAVCHNIIRVEPCWSGGKTKQNAGRLRRVGQTEITMLTNLIAELTVDDKVSRSCDRKIGTIDYLFSSEEDMALEDVLDKGLTRIATALEVIADKFGGEIKQAEKTTTSKKEEKEEKKKDDEPVGGGPTLDDLRKKAAEVMKTIKKRNNGDAEPGKQVLQGAVSKFAKDAKLDSVKPKDYAKLDAIFDGLLEEPSGDDEDMGV